MLPTGRDLFVRFRQSLAVPGHVTRADYVRLTEQGTKPPMDQLTLARKIAATVLAMWKNQEVYDPQLALLRPC